MFLGILNENEDETSSDVEEPLVRTRRIEQSPWHSFEMAARQYAHNSKNENFMRKFGGTEFGKSAELKDDSAHEQTNESQEQESPDGVDAIIKAEAHASEETKSKRQKLKFDFDKFKDNTGTDFLNPNLSIEGSKVAKETRKLMAKNK